MGFILAIVLLWFFGPRLFRWWLSWRRQTPEERSFNTRFTVFTWVVAILFIGAFLFLPNKGRVILLLPLFITGVTLARWWQNGRDRIRREAEMTTNFARARRLN